MSAEKSELIVRDSRAMSQPAPAPVQVFDREAALMEVISRAARDPSFDLDRMERLFALQKEHATMRAEREFTEAMAQFKLDAPRILKDRQVGFTSRRTGESTSYTHATLGAVCAAIVPALAAVGISHRWDTEQGQGGRITVTCVLTHRGGHSTRTSLSGSPDDSGQKNSLQQMQSAITYLERYTLLAATGMGTHDQDDDGRAAGAPAPVAKPDPAPEGFSNWWADYIACADDGLQKLEATWGSSSKTFRLYANKWYGSELARLKDVARGVPQ